MAGDVIKEFLVSLGFKIDGASERKFTDGVVRATKTVTALAVAAEAAAVAVGFAVSKISRSLEDLHWQSERTNASAKNIKSLSYAVSQLGGSYDGARQSIEQFGANLRTNPGYSSLVRSLGVATEKNGKLRDTADVLQDIGKALKTKPYYQAVQYANALGIDEQTFRALQSGDLSKWQEEYRAKVAAIGVDQTEAAKRGAEFTRSLRSLNETFGAMGEKLANDLAPAFAKFLDQVNNFLLQNADKISSFFGECAKGAALLATGFAKLIDLAEPLWKGFDEIARSLTGESGVAVAVAALGAAISASLLLRIAGLVGIVGRLAGGLTLLKSALALIGGGAGVAAGAALVASTNELNGGEDAEIARRRAEGSWGGGKEPGARHEPDKRNIWQRNAPKILGGKDKPSNTSAALESYNFWKSKGLTHEQAMGLVANEQAESGFDPKARGDGGKAHGLFQHHPDRRQAILNGTGIDISTADRKQQLEAAHWELTRGQEKKAWNALKGAKTTAEATDIITRQYERPGDKDGESAKRQKAAAGLESQMFPPAPNVKDISQLSTYRNGQMEGAPQGLIVHHTGGRGGPEDVVNTLNQRGLGVHYVMDREGNVSQTLPNGAKGAHMRPSEINGLSNANTLGIEVIAKDDKDVTEAQVRASKAFHAQLAKQFPGLQVFGHGEVNSHKQGTEGASIVGAIRNEPVAAPSAPEREPWPRTLPAKSRVDLNAALFGSIASAGSQFQHPMAGQSPLMPAATAGGDTSVNMNQKTEINVIGSSDPSATAGAIAAQQNGVNGGMLRNFQGAVR